jgi:hypothetical protein
MYGYNLGGDMDGWNFTEYDDENYRTIWPSWMELDDGDDPDDPITQMQDRLREKIGGFEDNFEDGGLWQADEETRADYFKRKHAAEKLVGITFDMYGVSDYTGWVIGFQVSESSGCLEEIEAPSPLITGYPYKEWEYRLAKVLEALEITLEDQPKPRLLALVSYF